MIIWGEKIVRKVRGALVAFVAAGTLMVGAEAMAVSYVAATWSDTSVHLLDANLADMGSFSAGASNPNGIATDGNLIWTGHFSTAEVIAYDFSGVEQFRWSDGARLGSLQGMELVNGELAVGNSGSIHFFDPFTGVFNRSIPSASGTVEGLAYDGSVLWQLDSTIVGINPADGSLITSIPNAAAGIANFDGTGITANAPGQLTLAGSAGEWWIVSSLDGSVINSGNNNLNMFGIKAVPTDDRGNVVPEPVTATLGLMGLGVLGMATRRRVA